MTHAHHEFERGATFRLGASLGRNAAKTGCSSEDRQLPAEKR